MKNIQLAKSQVISASLSFLVLALFILQNKASHEPFFLRNFLQCIHSITVILNSRRSAYIFKELHILLNCASRVSKELQLLFNRKDDLRDFWLIGNPNSFLSRPSLSRRISLLDKFFLIINILPSLFKAAAEVSSRRRDSEEVWREMRRSLEFCMK